MFATCAFNATSPCCLGIEARRRVEFTSAELAALVEKNVIDLVEKVATNLARTVIAPVEKAVRTLENAAVGWVRDGDGGKRAAVLGRGGDAGRRAQGRRGGAAEHGHSGAWL